MLLKRDNMSNDLIKKRVAVVGLSCRFAGAADIDELWRLLEKGTCKFTEMDRRFKDYNLFYNGDKSAKGKSYNKKAAFLDNDIYMFDTDFFEISAKEAVKTDVQQRLLLEVSYEALENAGININGSGAGVFIGGFMQDALIATTQKQNYYNLNEFDATGVSNGMLANRLSYFYDLHGPSLSIDTACSSSLVALHYASQSITDGTCSVAICGGVNILTELGEFIMLSKGGLLSAGSLCRAFGKDADGYARGEGAGILVLKDLEQAAADGDKIYCEILASHINHDGRKNGITLPNPDSQVDLFRRVIDKAGISIDGIDYVEAHGTGTQAGDRAELKAIGQVFKEKKEKIIVGSVKTNIGHTEAAAGVAGLIKSILILENKKIPKTLHCEVTNPGIPFDSCNIQLADKMMDLPKPANSCIGINSFGFGGANAHVIISNVQNGTDKKAEKNAAGNVDENHNNISGEQKYVFLLSARSKKSLSDLAAAYAAEMEIGKLSETGIDEICASAATRRNHLEHRLAVISDYKNRLINDLKCFSNKIQKRNILYNKCNPKRNNKCVAVFSGMGAQTKGMGTELYKNFSVFKNVFDECKDVFLKISGIDLCEYISVKDTEWDIYGNLEILQPFNLAYQISLFSLMKQFGIEYDAVIGHSAGEMAAFYCGGLVSLEHIFKVAFSRSHFQQKLNNKGKMLVLDINRAGAEILCGEYSGKISLAAVNGENSIVLSGDENALIEIQKEMDAKNNYSKFLDGNIAYHSFQMEIIKDGFIDSLKSLEYTIDYDNKTVVYSTVMGRKMNKGDYNELYWWNNIRNPVEFYKTIDEISGDGYETFIEIAPHAVLKYYIAENYISKGRNYAYVSLQDKKMDQVEAFYKSIADMHCDSFKIDWKSFYKCAKWLPLPKYKWDKKRLEPIITNDRYINSDCENLPVSGQKLNLPVDIWESIINLNTQDWVKGHKIGKNILFPAAGYIEMMIETGTKLIKNVCITSPVTFTDSQDFIFNLTKYENGRVSVSSSSYLRDAWNVNCLAEEETYEYVKEGKNSFIDINKIKEEICVNYEKDSIYTILKEKSLCYEGGFKIIKNAGIGENFVLAEVDCSCQHAQAQAQTQVQAEKNIFILDGMLQALALAKRGDIANDRNYIHLPVEIEEILFNGTEAGCLYIYSKITNQNTYNTSGESFLINNNGEILIEMKGIKLNAVPNAASKQDGLENGVKDKNINCYETVWEEAENIVSAGSGTYISADISIEFWATGGYLRDSERIIDIVKDIGEKRAVLTVITSNALKVIETDKVQNYRQAVLWGLCRCIRLEHGNITVKLLDMDETAGFNTAEITENSTENELALRNGVLYGLRIKKQKVTGYNEPDGTAVITGASGGLAYTLALDTAERGINNIALTSRGYSEQIRILSDVLSYFKINVKFYKADVSDYKSLEYAWNQIEQEFPDIKNVYHLAGISKDCMIMDIDSSILKETFTPKITGSENLYNIIKSSGHINSIRLNLFGSIVGLIGNIGQGAYAASNLFMDSFCEFLKTDSVNCRLIGFGALNTGMSISRDDILKGFDKQALKIMDARDAISISNYCGGKSTYIAKIYWNKFLNQTNRRDDAKFKYLKEIGKHLENNLKEKLSALKYDEQLEILCGFLIKSISIILETEASAFDSDKITATMGINSLNSVLIANIINRNLGINLSYVQVAGNFSIKDLAKRILNIVFTS